MLGVKIYFIKNTHHIKKLDNLGFINEGKISKEQNVQISKAWKHQWCYYREYY
jgi:hypothetical protein